MKKTIGTIAVNCWLVFLLTGQIYGMENEECFACHSQQDIKAETEKGESLNLYLSEDTYCENRHEIVECIQCHQPAHENGFQVTPHQIVQTPIPDCKDCHGHFFDKFNKGFEAGIHKISSEGAFRCDSCHDPHQPMYLEDIEYTVENPTVADHIEFSNRICLQCHQQRIQSDVGKIEGMKTAHQSLEAEEKHLKAVRCVDCHTHPMDMGNHQVLPKSKTVDCISCHSTETLLVNKLYKPQSPVLTEYRFLNKGLFQDTGLIKKITKAGGKLPVKTIAKYDNADWDITNQPLINHFYVIGAIKHKTVDRVFHVILVGLVGLVVLHGAIRLMLSLKRKKKDLPVEDYYLYALWLRIWHWLNALLIILLLASGYALHFSETGNRLISFHTAVRMHKISGILLLTCYLVFIIGNLVSGNIKNYIPHVKGVVQRFQSQIRHYGWGIFKGESCPYVPVTGRKFNPLQKTAYLVIMFCVLPIIAITGILLLIPGVIPAVVYGENSKWLVSLIHYCAATLFFLFLIIHLYLITTGDRVLFLLRGMITGYHRSHKTEE